MTIDELFRPGTVARVHRARRRDVAGMVLAALFVGYVVWCFAAVHPGGPLATAREPNGPAAGCMVTGVDRPGDVTQRIPFSAPDDLTVLSVHLVDPNGVSLTGAEIGSVPVEGARLARGTGGTLVLHLWLDDAQRASFADVAVVYRSGPFRYDARLGVGEEYVPAGACA